MVELKLGLNFTNKELIKEALTHPSMRRKNNDYERMEFLGDHVLGLVIAEQLYKKFPLENEGQLTKRLAGLICGATLVKVARTIELGSLIEMAASEEASGGRDNKANLENAMEAVIGALFLDQGIEVAREFILRNWMGLIEEMVEPPKDAKSSLQEWAQGKGLPLPDYQIVATTGLMHAPVFEVSVGLKGYPTMTGNGLSKRAAEQEAAAKLLASIS